jgi:uncharacterized protein
MAIKRAVLLAIAVLVVWMSGQALLSSWNQPQAKDALGLYQADLVLQASEWPTTGDDAQFAPLRQQLLGGADLGAITEQYEGVVQDLRSTIDDRLANATKNTEAPADSPGAQSTRARRRSVSLKQLKAQLDQLDLKTGILQAVQGKVELAEAHWRGLDDADAQVLHSQAIVQALWSPNNPGGPTGIPTDAESWIQAQFKGWFRDQSLLRLYDRQDRQDEGARLSQSIADRGRSAAIKLAAIGVIPVVGGFVGSGLLLVRLGLRLVRGKKPLVPWSVPWDWETIAWVLIGGFFFVGQFIVSQLAVPLAFQLGGIDMTNASARVQALTVLVIYGAMSLSVLGVLALSVGSFSPLPEGWFRLKLSWGALGWGLGGYLMALPLVVLVSVLNQQIWQGNGGANPLYGLILESNDPLAKVFFFVTAAIAAPLFEEIIFRGFLLASLTRYLPVWAAIGVSSLIFALAHLSLAEVLPLTTLALVLGYVYSRSRNLLAPMLVHCLWNSATLVSLFLLGG